MQQYRPFLGLSLIGSLSRSLPAPSPSRSSSSGVGALMDSLWHTSNAWPTVRTIRIAWVCNSKRVFRHQDILIHMDEENVSCCNPQQCRRSSGIQTRFGRPSHGCFENYMLQDSCLPENISTAVHPLAPMASVLRSEFRRLKYYQWR